MKSKNRAQGTGKRQRFQGFYIARKQVSVSITLLIMRLQTSFFNEAHGIVAYEETV